MLKKSWLAPSIVGFVLIYGVLYIWQPGGVRVLNLLTGMLAVLAASLASVMALRASRMFEPGTAPRRAWLLFGIGLAMLAAAELVWAYYRIVLDQTLPFPLLADILWALSYVPILVSLVLVYRALGVQATRRRKLGVAALYLSVLIVALTISAVSEPGQIVTTDLLLNAFYLAGDMSIAYFATLSLMFLWKGLVSRPWQYLMTSVLLFVIADVTFSYGSANNLYATGTNVFSGTVDALYLAAYLLAAAGGYRQLTLRLPG